MTRHPFYCALVTVLFVCDCAAGVSSSTPSRHETTARRFPMNEPVVTLSSQNLFCKQLDAARTTIEKLRLMREESDRIDAIERREEGNAASMEGAAMDECNVDFLLGAREKDVLRELGANQPSNGTSELRNSQCNGPTQDLIYSYFYLPEGWVGGGPHLIIRFNAKGVCCGTGWFDTQ